LLSSLFTVERNLAILTIIPSGYADCIEFRNYLTQQPSSGAKLVSLLLFTRIIFDIMGNEVSLQWFRGDAIKLETELRKPTSDTEDSYRSFDENDDDEEDSDYPRQISLDPYRLSPIKDHAQTCWAGWILPPLAPPLLQRCKSLPKMVPVLYSDASLESIEPVDMSWSTSSSMFHKTSQAQNFAKEHCGSSDETSTSSGSEAEEGAEPLHLQLHDSRISVSTAFPTRSPALDQGSFYERHGSLAKALQSYQSSLQELSDLSLLAGTHYRVGVVQWKKGAYDDSLHSFKQSLATYHLKACAGSDEDIAQVYLSIGRVYASKGKHRKAKKSFKLALKLIVLDEVLDHNCEVSNRVQVLYAKILLAYGSILVEDFDYATATNLFDDALAIQKEVLGDMHVDVASTLLSFGSLNEKLEKLEDANTCYWEAFQIYRSADSSAVDMGVTLTSIGWIYYQQHNLESAMHAYQDALDLLLPKLGDNHRNVASVRIQIGMVHIQKNELDLALEQYKEALRAQRIALGDEHKDVAITLSLIGATLESQGRFNKAIEFVDRALCIRKKDFGPSHLHVGTTLAQLGELYKIADRPEAAAQCLRDAVSVFRANQVDGKNPCLVQSKRTLRNLRRSRLPAAPNETL
jgi:tetratricopeptide (TPR) repeat protein